MKTFQLGQKVQATTSLQGLILGELYTVKAVYMKDYFVGTYIGYEVIGSDNKKRLIWNGDYVFKAALDTAKAAN